MAADDDLKHQLGSLVRTALAQFETVRGAVVQRSKVGRIQLDVAMLKRQRKAALVELGAAVAELAATGRISEDDFPTLSGPLSRLESIDERIAGEIERAERVRLGADAAPIDPLHADDPDEISEIDEEMLDRNDPNG